jgi:Polyketide cyclase / dehydrase and lipid transport
MEGKPRVYESAVVPAPRQQVWQKIRDFNALPAWHPGIAKSELEGGDCVGCVRHFFLQNGAELRERLLALSDLDCTCVYSMLESPMPLKNYVATLRLYEITATNQTFAEWIAYFDVTDASAEADTVETVHGVFKTGFESLMKFFG